MAEKTAEQASGGILPEWIRVLPLGKVELADSREPLEVDAAALDAMVAAFQAQGVDLVIDYEHQSLQGERAPAAGWIKNLEARSDGLWAQVEWTPQAQEYLRQREYRYFSPVLRLDPETRKPLSLMHLGLTNVPAIKNLPPLVAKWGGDKTSLAAAGVRLPASAVKEGEVVLQLKRVLDLGPDAGHGVVWRKTLEGFRELGTTLDLPAEASWSSCLGRVQALKAAAAGTDTLRQEVLALKTRLAEESANRSVREALKAGKVSPAQKDWALEYYRRDPEGFAAYVSRAPQVVPAGAELQLMQGEAGAQDGLLPEERAICQALKILPGAYLQVKGRVS
jgi:phage I-like protein